ncbi:diacylglycerol O-acyltransferase 1-like [Lytechinus pictus]|uniref:diacylglycerol O-acyltransferase 1-like n=1 Tax=Lytechinus pictus TaxID=7653 RepID=UPI0030B9E0AA
MTLENIIENGILMSFGIGVNPFEMPLLYLLLALNLFILVALVIEKLASKDYIGCDVEKRLANINLVILLIVPVVVIYTLKLNPVGSFVVVGLYTITFLKLWSYADVNRALRVDGAGDAPVQDRPLTRRRSRRLLGLGPEPLKSPAAPEPTIQAYPDNLNLRDMYFFMLSPTLCYDINFPRTDRVRKTYLLRLVVELIILIQVWLFMLQQWTAPAVVATAEPLMDYNIIGTVESFLSVALANHLSWLLFFYIYFHLLLNIFAEVTCFADRNFYSDWWNSSNIEEFWRKWNIPVHKWCVRHVYKPVRGLGYSKFQAVLTVYLLSAIFHEYLASVPLKLLTHWSFGGMMAQVLHQQSINIAMLFFFMGYSFIFILRNCVLFYELPFVHVICILVR